MSEKKETSAWILGGFSHRSLPGDVDVMDYSSAKLKCSYYGDVDFSIEKVIRPTGHCSTKCEQLANTPLYKALSGSKREI